MSIKKRLTVSQWIDQVFADTDKQHACSMLSLIYCKPVGGGIEEIHSKALDVGGNHNAAQLGAFFVSRAESYAQDLPGVSMFKLLAFFGSDQPGASFPFTVSDGAIAAGDMGLSRHEATPAGLMGMLMKHNEQTNSVLNSIVQTVVVQSVQRENHLREQLDEAHVVFRDMLLNMNKETHAMQMQKLEFARGSEDRKTMMRFLPTVVNQLAGKPVIPEEKADTELIEALALNVKPDQLQALVQAGLLPQHVGGLLMARFAQVHEQKQAEARLVESAPPETHTEETPQLAQTG